MLVATRGIVLHTTKYADHSLIINIFTEEFGTRAFMVKNAFSKKNKINYAYFSPLALLELHFYQKKSDIHFLKEVSFHCHYSRIPLDPVRQSLLFFYNEFLYKLLFQYGEDKSLFHFLENSLLELDSEVVDAFADIHLRFMVKLSHYLGFFPEQNHSEKNAHFNLLESAFQPYFFDNGDFLSKEASLYLNQLMQGVHHNVTTPLPHKVIRNELLHFLVKYFELHHEGIKKIESIDILVQLLH